MSPDIARLYFVEVVGQAENEVVVPDGVSLIDTLNGVNIIPFQNSFLISWLSSYSLNRNDNPILQISNQKQQSLRIIATELDEN